MANIVHFGKYYFPDNGGIESVTLSLSKGAALHGHNVSVICFGKKSAIEKEIIDNVYVIRTPITKILASQPLGFKYCLQCLRSAKDADIVHLHAPNMLGAICAIFIPIKTRLLVHWHSDVINKGLLGKFLHPLESLLLRRANIIVATSQLYANASKTLTPFKNKITIAAIGVSNLSKKSKKLEIPVGITEKINGRKIILVVGRLVPYKGLDVLIKAAQLIINDAVIVIVGEGPLEHVLKKSIDTSGLSNRIFLTGRLSNEHLNSLFQSASLYCLPSIHRAEAFGVVLIEAMSCGLPIVASEILGSGVSWVNKHGYSGLNFAVGDVQALANACNQILLSKELQTKFSDGARQRFFKHFTEDIAVERMMNIYKNLLIDN